MFFVEKPQKTSKKSPKKYEIHFVVCQKFLPLRAFKEKNKQCKEGRNIKYNLQG